MLSATKCSIRYASTHTLLLLFKLFYVIVKIMETMSKNRPARMQKIPRLTDDMGQTHPTINAIRDKCKEVDKRDDPDRDRKSVV